MKRIILFLILSFWLSISFGQNKAEAEKLVKAGIDLHDHGDFNGAISKYDKALKLDKDNLFALTEKGVSLVALQNYEEAIKYCQKAIATHPNDKGLNTVYVSYGNAADGLNDTDRAIEIYDEGIKQFPDFYQLFYNKGVSLSRVGRFDEGVLCFQKAVKINPNHAGSHHAMGQIANFNHKRIPALLAYWRFLELEPLGDRASETLEKMIKLMNDNVEQNSKDSVSVYYGNEMFEDTSKNDTPIENNFLMTDLILSMDAARDYLKEYKNKSEVEKFIRKLDTVCASLKETRKDNTGFFWKYYAPYFIEMKEKNFIEPYAYLVFMSRQDPGVVRWLNAHNNELENFLNWTTAFNWKIN